MQALAQGLPDVNDGRAGAMEDQVDDPQRTPTVDQASVLAPLHDMGEFAVDDQRTPASVLAVG
jgi:hypothetical protein